MIKETDINGKRIRVGDCFVVHESPRFVLGDLGIVVSEGCFFALMEEETTIGGIKTIEGEQRWAYAFTGESKVEIIDHHSLKYWGLVDKNN